MAVGSVGNRQGSVECFDIKSGKILHCRTMTQLTRLIDNQPPGKKVEARGKKGARAIKNGCIKILNRKGEKFDWKNDDLSDLDVASEQPKVGDSGLADIPLDSSPNKELRAH